AHKGRGMRAHQGVGQEPLAQPGHWENMTVGSHHHRHEGGPAALPPRTPVGHWHHRRAPSWNLDPTAGGPEATPATSPTPGQHAQNLIHPQPSPTLGYRHAPPWECFLGPRWPYPSPHTQHGHGHWPRFGTGVGREPPCSGRGSRTRWEVPHAPSIQATTSPMARTQGPAWCDPSRTERGEARATVGDEQPLIPTAGTCGTLFSLSLRSKMELCLHMSESNCYSNTTTMQREEAGQGILVPQGTPLGLLEKASSLRSGHTPPPTGCPSLSHPQRCSGTPREGREMWSTMRGGKPEAPRNHMW
ncbi:hypothetical protein P7K49_039532, partial [Saguinus oedipus]